MSRDADYWQKRAEQRLTEMEKYSGDYIRRVKKIYEQAERNIKKEIANVYKNYASQTGLSVSEVNTSLRVLLCRICVPYGHNLHFKSVHILSGAF